MKRDRFNIKKYSGGIYDYMSALILSAIVSNMPAARKRYIPSNIACTCTIILVITNACIIL